MNREVLSKYDVMTVGEGGGVAVEDALKFVADDRHELQTFFQFELVDRWGRRPDNWMYPDSGTRSLPAAQGDLHQVGQRLRHARAGAPCSWAITTRAAW